MGASSLGADDQTRLLWPNNNQAGALQAVRRLVEGVFLPPASGDTAPYEGPYVLRNKQVVELSKQSETGDTLKIPDRIRNSKGERGFPFRNTSPILPPFRVCRVLAFLKGQEQCHTVCDGGFPLPMLSRRCVLSLRKQNKIKIKTAPRHLGTTRSS